MTDRPKHVELFADNPVVGNLLILTKTYFDEAVAAGAQPEDLLQAYVVAMGGIIMGWPLLSAKRAWAISFVMKTLAGLNDGSLSP